MNTDNGIQQDGKWNSILEYYSNTGGILLVLGGVDTGKSTFVRWLANEVLKKGKQPAIIDCDVGQSDIGPPATIGLSVIKEPFSNYGELSTNGIFFTGGVQPIGKLLQCLTGIIRLKEKALQLGSSHIIVNTTGWIEGAGGYYKHCKIDALNPSVMIAIEKRRELSSIIAPFRRINSIKTYRLTPSSSIRIRSREDRRETRKENFAKYFKEAGLIALSVNRLGISGESFPLSPKRLENQLIVLIDECNVHSALGIVKSYDTKSHVFEILTPLKLNPQKIRRLHFEKFRFEVEKSEQNQGCSG